MSEGDPVERLWSLAVNNHGEGFLEQAEREPDAVLLRVIGKLATGGAMHGPRFTAFRDALRAVLDHRNTERVVETTLRLERAASRVAWVGVAVAIVGTVATVAGVVLGAAG